MSAIKKAAEMLRREAESMKECHTIGVCGEWYGDSVKAEYDEMIAAADAAIAECDALRAAVCHEADCVEACKAEVETLLARIEVMERQEPVAFALYSGWARNAVYLSEIEACEQRDRRQLTADLGGSLEAYRVVPLYLAPGAQPAPSVPEDVMRDAERYRYLRARDEETAGVGCWLEAKGRACDRGWLYGVQLDSAIDSFIEMLAAAPEVKS